MGYGRTIKPSDLERLRPLFEALETLPEGKGITYTDHPLQISKDRTIIYTYWDIHNQKGIFKLSCPRPEEIKIIRLETYTPAVDLAARLSEFTAPASKKKPAVAAAARHSLHQAAQEAQPQPKDFRDLLKKKYGAAEEEAQLPREQVPEDSGIEFYNKHADTTWPEIHKLVSTAQAAGELSDIEANQALTEWQHRNPEFKPSNGSQGSQQRSI